MAIKKPESTGIQKASKIAFNNTNKISQQGNKEKISGSIRDLKKTIKVNSNPNPKPYKGNQELGYAGRVGAGEAAEEGRYNTGDEKTPVIKIHSSTGVLGGAHMGGHSDVSTAINLGGFTVKTPIVKPSSTKNK